MSIDVRHEGAELVIRVRTDSERADALVPIALEPLAALGLGLEAIRKLVAEGKLKTVAIGRKHYTKASYLVALVDVLPATTARQASDDGPDDLVEAIQRRARRTG